MGAKLNSQLRRTRCCGLLYFIVVSLKVRYYVGFWIEIYRLLLFVRSLLLFRPYVLSRIFDNLHVRTVRANDAISHGCMHATVDF